MNSIIYKYLPIERLTYLNDELLRITQPAELNDPFELLPITPSEDEMMSFLFNLCQSAIDSLTTFGKSDKEQNEIAKAILDHFNNEVKKYLNSEEGNIKDILLKQSSIRVNNNIGILSLSRRWDSTLMWSHYTNSHKGICIGFNSEDSFFSNFRQFEKGDKIFMPVSYSDNRIKTTIEHKFYNDFKLLFSKSKDWEYEEEERFLVFLKNAENVIQNTPYDIFLFKVPHKLIKEIIFGVNCDNKSIEALKKFCSLNAEIKLFKCKLSETKYDMERQIYCHQHGFVASRG